VIGYFDSDTSRDFAVYHKVVSILRDDCTFHAAIGSVPVYVVLTLKHASQCRNVCRSATTCVTVTELHKRQCVWSVTLVSCQRSHCHVAAVEYGPSEQLCECSLKLDSSATSSVLKQLKSFGNKKYC